MGQRRPKAERRNCVLSAEPTAMVAPLGQCFGLGASTPSHQLHLVVDFDFPAFNQEAVERQVTVEAPVDAVGDFLILDQGVGVV